jgi:hypothetical protein
METYRIETTLTQPGAVTLRNLPFQKGDLVEIIVFRRSVISPRTEPSPLRGMVLNYDDPAEPVAQEDWEVVT